MANKSSINIDLDDPRAGKIAEVMSSKTAKSILNLLAEKEMSSSEIAEKLGIPLNTVTYNLNKLVEAGLVGKSKTFFWSSKGKRMELYKVLNKRIVIYPKMMSKSVIAALVGVFAILAIALVLVSLNQQGFERGEEGNLQKFSSYEDLKSYLEENIAEGGAYGGVGLGRNAVGMEESFAATDSAVVAPSAAGAAKSEGDSAQAADYSETNIQVEGVDEPDIVKNDGEYIYVVSGKKVVIIDAYPAEDMKKLSEIELDENYISNIFVNGDKLVVFTQNYEYIDSGVQCNYEFYDIGVRCGGYSKQTTNVYVYDISDRENPEKEDEYEFGGNYVDARMIGDFVYVISSEYIDTRFFDLPVYSVNGVETKIAADEIYHFNAPDENYVFNTISAIDLDSGEAETETYLMGYSYNIYVSQDNIYLTYQKQLSQKYYYEKYIGEVLIPVLPSEQVSQIKDIMDSDYSFRKKTREISEIMQDYQDSLEEEDLMDFYREYQNRTESFYREIQKESEKTVIHKINVDGLNIDYKSQGEVPGRVLNQFSMDEFEGNFRIATTTGGWNRDKNVNNLYVLNEDLEIIGSVEDLAKGEQIYSARFTGDKAYLVTFRQTDPLFVIDLSNPENPKVLGELKITGYSGYLHPYDENHLLGIGMEATESGRTTGVKVTLFDVTDMSNPKEIDSFVVTQGQWSSSEAVYDHKAVLFDREKNLLVIPVSYNKEVAVAGQSWPRYEYWQGAFVFNVDLDGIDLKGKVTHQEKESDDYWYGGGYVKRSLFMDDVLYTVSEQKVKANDLNTLNDIEEVDLPYEDYPGPYYYADGGVGIAESAMVK